MRSLLGVAAVTAVFGIAGAAFAEPYVDYVPKKGVWEVESIAVDPNHIDDYLVGLKAEFVPGLEVAKQHGIIDRYGFKVKLNPSGSGTNVLIIRHYPSLTTLEADKARDQAVQKEVYAKVSKEVSDKKVKEFETYRKFVSDEFWVDMDMIDSSI